MGVTGQFIDSARGRILVVCHQPVTPNGQTVIVFPALAEEMNKSRRLLWDLGQRLADVGIATIIPDLYGTGDSEGDFAQARWEDWRADIAATVAWACTQGFSTHHALLVRLGACLFSECREIFEQSDLRVAAWQPEHDGNKALRQLLRLKVMSDRITWGGKTKLADLEQRLQTDALEVGGYLYAPEMAQALRKAKFDWSDLPTGAKGCFLDWTRAGASDDESDSLVSTVTRVPIDGQRFWTAVEPDANAGLITATADFFAGAV